MDATEETLERRLFTIPSFNIYGGVAGLYDYGPPGCRVKAIVLTFWKQYFVIEEKSLEVDCSCITPEAVLKASGHVDKFTNLMVKDENTGTCYQADHLLKDFCEEKLEKDLCLPLQKAAELKHILAVLNDLSAEELGAKIKEYGITAPNTKNPLSDPYPFNLMFKTSIGPSGLLPGYLRPETAQGIFVNFNELNNYNGNKLPFAVAQIGQVFRNEIAPRQGLPWVREFTLAEIEYFVDPEDKSHPKYKKVVDLEFLFFPRDEQVSGQQAKKMRLGEAVSKGIVNNETLGYFIGRVYLFLTHLGIDKERLRFRQHLANELAHYAADCWDAEIESSYGWIKCVGIADRSTYDLKAHSEKSGASLVAHEKFQEPREIEKLVITPVKKELGLVFKGNQKKIVEALEAMNEKEAMEMKSTLESKGEIEFHVCTLGKAVTIKSNMVLISKDKKKEHRRVFTPCVIESSFVIGRIIYCLYEHSFYTSPSKAGDEQLNVFRFPPMVAPIKCTVFPLIQKRQHEEVAHQISEAANGISHKIDITGTSIGKRYARPYSTNPKPYSPSPSSPSMNATEETLLKILADKQSSVTTQANVVRDLKAAKASKPEIEAAVHALNALKLNIFSVEQQLQAVVTSNGGVNKKDFRATVQNTLERRLFYMQSFHIYGGVAGLYDYGPPGCCVKANVLTFWRQYFVIEENMLEVDCSCITPVVVLKASGHVDKFTDLMVKDEKTGTCYRADHLLKDFCEEKLEKDLSMSLEKAADLKHILAVLDDLSAEQLGVKIKEYGITAPDTKNPLSDPYPFNLMFQISIGPSGLLPGYMRPETAQGIFVNFNELYNYNENKLPFAAAQIGQAFRNEIAPRQGLLRVREFTLAEIEHFVDPEDKSHPKYKKVVDLEFLFFPRDEQVSGQQAKKMRLGDAVSKGIVNNETLGYFIGRVYLFLTHLGIDKERLRFRQHLANEMAHYAADCWDAEIESSYGWIECVGIADRSAYDLIAHSGKSGASFVAHEKFQEPREIEAMNEKDHQRIFTPSVIEPSFGIGRIIYCMYEHCFYTRPSKAGDEQLNVFRFPPLVAPIKCTVFPLVQQPQYEEVAQQISEALTANGIPHKIDITGTSIGKRYARTDELGVPFAITVDSTSSVTIRERDSRSQIRVGVDEVAMVVKEMTEGQTTWADVQWKYPAHSSTAGVT